jgi:hypothetical protein
MRITRRLFLIMFVYLAFLLSQVSRADVITGSAFRLWGNETLTQIDADFGRSDGLYNNSTIQKFPDYAWGQGVMFHANVAAAKVDSSRLTRTRQQAQAIHDQYRCYFNGIWGYNAGSNSCGDRYYDDNAWLALAYLELYEITSDTTYLGWAQEIVAFCMSGENGPLNIPTGGIRWHESNTGGGSICATAPTCLANLITYQNTGIESYKTNGLRLYNWLMTSGDYRYSSGIYHEMSQGALGYQTAVVTQAAVHLYQITGTNSYLLEAQRMAFAMEGTFINSTTHALGQYGRWGGHDMTNAYVELYEEDGNTYWLDLAGSYLEHLYVNCIDGATGLYPEQWNDTSGAYSTGLIDAACVARAYWKMAGTPGAATSFDYFAKRLRGRWKLDETSGTVAADSSGLANNGTLSGVSFSFDTNAVSGQWNGALNFDGTDDYLDLPDGFDNFRGGMTISLWAYPTAAKNWARFVDMGNGQYNNNIVFARRGTTNDLAFEAYDGTASGGQVTAAGAIQLNQWQMFTATLNASGTVTLYKNGSQVATGTTALPSNIARINNYIGRSNWAADAWFQGRMDDVKIYNYALTPQEVQSIYLSGGQAQNPSPVNEAKNVLDVTTLKWTAGSLAANHDIYLGTDQAAVMNATTASPEYKGRQSETTYTPTLSEGTTWYWRVDEITAGSAIATGGVWQFTTFAWPVQNLMAHYPMDNVFISGSTLIDTSGSSPQLSGSILGPAAGAAGPIAEALNFDGVNDYVDLPDGFSDFTGGMTVSVWVYPTAANNWARFIDFGNGAPNNNIVFARNGTSNTLSFEAYNGSTGGGSVSASEAIALNQWQLFTATLSRWGYAVLYKNGVRIASGQTAIPPIVTRTNNYIGKSNWPDAYYKGRIDDLGIWSRALTSAEVAGVYDRGLAGRSFVDGPDPQAPVAYWQFNDNGGSVLSDSSGSGHNGQLMNMDTASWTRGKQCGGLAFDGTNDYVKITGYKGITGTASRTCSAWIKTSGSAANMVIMDWGAAVSGQKWLFGIFATGQLALYTWTPYIQTNITVTDNQWHHVAAVLVDDGTPNVNEIKLYVDGLLQAVTVSSAQAINTAIASDVLLGACDNAGAKGFYFNGLMDEVRIYDRSVTAAEIQAIYRAHVLVGDSEPDGDVDLADFAHLAEFWQAPNACDADLTCDCIVDIDDLMILTEEWMRHYAIN